LLAAKQGHTTVVELLLNEGDMDPNARNEGGQTPLLCAAKRGHEQVVKLLLDRGANVNAQGGNALDAAPS
jgi:ankyrin repeat protein